MTVFIIAFVMGSMARPGVDIVFGIISPFFEPKEVVYSAPKYSIPEIKKDPYEEEFEKGVTAMLKTPQHQSLCKSQAEMVVADNLRDKYALISNKYDERGENAQASAKSTIIKIANGISDETADAMIALETKAGRR
jgi:hypothetical protein